MSGIFRIYAVALIFLATGALAPPILAQSGTDAGGGAQTTPRQSPSDRDLAQRIYAKLNSDQVDYYKHVTVLADNGVVTLGGSVGTTEALNKAKKIASGVPGVTKVVDQMALERAPARSGGE
jgi:osmotically-inducible protein OsmY